MRNIHNKLYRSGHVNSNREQHIAIDYDDIPDPTMRNIHNKLDRSGHVTGNREQHMAIDYDDIPDPTMRNVHDRYDRAGHIDGQDKQTYYVNYNDIPEVTMRNIHQCEQLATVTGQYARQGSRHNYMGMSTNVGKEQLEEKPQPTTVGMDKGWTIDHTAFYFRNPVNPKWRPNPSSDIMCNNDTLGFANKVPNGRFYVNNRILSFVDENLKNNPYVNNLVHISI